MDALITSLAALARSPLAGSALVLFLLRLTIVAALGRLALVLLARASAATRHAAALIALAATLVLPLLSVAVPGWDLAVLPAARAHATSDVVATPAPRPAVLATPAPSRDAAAVAPVTLASPAPAPAPAPTPALRPVRSAAASAPWAALASWAARISFARLALWIALAISAFMLLRVAAGIVAAGWIAARAEEPRAARLQRAYALAGAQARLEPLPPLRMSGRVRVPAVHGMLRPQLVLPTDAGSWEAERLHAVFLHELAHVRRRDVLAHLFSRAVVALYWFHPLVRLLGRDVARECERACDDLVLEWGLRPSDYAGHLLAIAQAAGRRESAGGMTLAFARRSSLEGRLLSILSADRRRGRASRVATAAAMLLMSAVVIPLASVRLVAAAAPQPVRVAQSIGVPTSQPRTVTSTRVQTMTQVRVARETRATTTAVAAAPVLASVEAANAAGGDPGRIELAGSRSGSSWFSHGRDLYQDHRYLESAEAYVQAGNEGYRVGTAYYNAACSYALAGRRNEGLAALRTALEDGFDDPKLIQTDDDLDALRSDPRFADLLDEAMHSTKADAERREARADYDALKDSDHASARELRSAGVELMRAGDTDRALKAFAREFAMDSSASTLYDIACAEALGGDRDRALMTLRTSILSGYGGRDGIAGDADLVALHGDRRFDALLALADKLQLDLRGDSDNDRARWREALPRYERVVHEDPSLARGWFNLGFAELRMHDLDGSHDAFLRALGLGYRRPTTEYNLACVAAQARQTDAALEWLERSQAAGMDLTGLLLTDSDLDPIRGSGRFISLCARLAVDKVKWKDKDKGKDKSKNDDD